MRPQEEFLLSLYEKLPTDVLAKFYYEIQKNIDRGVLSNAMYHETNLIKMEAEKRGLSLLELKQQGKK
jgi:hypothetical protein